MNISGKRSLIVTVAVILAMVFLPAFSTNAIAATPASEAGAHGGASTSSGMSEGQKIGLAVGSAAVIALIIIATTGKTTTTH